MGRNSSVGIAGRYGLEGRELYPGGSEIFRTRPDRPWAHSAAYKMGTIFLAETKEAGAWR